MFRPCVACVASAEDLRDGTDRLARISGCGRRGVDRLSGVKMCEAGVAFGSEL